MVWVPESEEVDALWARGESPEEAAERCYRLLVSLCHSGHAEVAVGSHSHILFMMMNAVVHTGDEDLRSWFATGEMRTVVLRWEGDLEAEQARLVGLSLRSLSTDAVKAAL